jgi:hypothetical protein
MQEERRGLTDQEDDTMPPGVRWARYAHLVVAWLFLLGLAYQVFLIGLYLFAGGDLSAHRSFGWTLAHGLPVLFIFTTLLSRLPRREGLWVVALLVSAAVQPLLAAMKDSNPSVAALHPVNALLLFGLTLVVADHARNFVPSPLGRMAAQAEGAVSDPIAAQSAAGSPRPSSETQS